MELFEYRREIDELDKIMVSLFCRRMQVAAKIGAYKRERGLPVLQPQREREKLAEVESLAGETMAPYVRALFEKMMELSRDYQHETGKFGLLGRTLGHSYSPEIHALLGTYAYDLYPREPEQVEEFLRNGPLSGMNVTMPYKKAVIPFLDELTPTAQKLGAVNTIVRREGRLIGHNTDYQGFRYLVKKSGLEPRGKKCLVLGSGGASATVCTVLEELGGDVVVISRRGENHYGNLERHSDAAILVNTTPVGMYPDVGHAPVSLEKFPKLEGVLDVVYNPARTALIMDGEKRGLVALGGLGMLVAQAAEAAQWFSGEPVSEERVEAVLRRIQGDTENIILIGMPGCGKSTTARLLQERLPQRRAVEMDAEIEKMAGKTIPEIFAEDGEAAFRMMETCVLAKFCAGSGQIIATGGGCVTREENYRLLHQNGRIFWLWRALEELPTDGRPLSQQHTPLALYAQREEMYRRFADHRVESCDVEEICRLMGGNV